MQWQSLVLLLMLRATSDAVRWRKEELFCELLQKEWKDNADGRLPYINQTLDMAFYWSDDLAYAAAALLRATLVAAGYNADTIKLYNRHYRDPSAANSKTLTVEVTMAAQLQVRLTPRAAHSPACKNVSSWSFYQDTNALRRCDFIVPGTFKSTHGNIYILNEWNNTCVAEFIRNSITTTSSMRLVYLDRSNLTEYIRNSDNSFIFLDTFQRSNTTDVQLINLPPTANNTHCPSTHYNNVLLKYADGLLPDSFVVFTPSMSDLNSILDENHAKNQTNIEEAACKWALQGSETFKDWRISAILKLQQSFALVIICRTETQDTFNKLLYMTKIFDKYFNNSFTNFAVRESSGVTVIYHDCANIDLLLKISLIMFRKNIISQLEGVILPENMAAALASYAAKLEVPLLTYDVKSELMVEPEAVRSVTGSVKHLEVAMRRLLADCGWQRLAVISDMSPLAIALSAALRAPTTGLTIREVNITSPSDIPRAIQELQNANARVFLVNTGAATAAAILNAAFMLNITQDSGFVWILREYDASDKATSAIKPYSVSFWWRGERGNETSNEGKKINMLRDSGKINGKGMRDKMDLREKLEEQWRGRAWPLHAAPILDALLTLREGMKRYQYNTSWSWHRDKNVRSFWNYVQKQHIPGIKQNLTYDERGVMSPLVFVEQWGMEPRPRLLAKWRGSEWREPAEACLAIHPPLDGSTYCLLPSGDPFQPKCWDILWISFALLSTLAGVSLIVLAIHCSRKAITARDLRIKTEFAKRLLARRERVFEALAEHLVDRSALELLQELGTGRFGRVRLGLLREPGSKNQNIVVAVKALREEAPSSEESEFLREACTLATLNHDHIIRFRGICVIDGPPLLLMEHAFFGDLLDYLRARRCLAQEPMNTESVSNGFQMDEKAYVSAKSLTKFAQEAATALSYLAQRGIVHRDLRASNCLVDERRCLKLADFGLARATGTVDGEYACGRGLFPVLWMAPESLSKGVTSAASDVWSFGVLVFELVTLGRRPYGELPPPTVLRHVLAGGQPKLPWDASAETRALTRACWRRKPEDRPTALQLADWLSTQWQALRPALVTELVDIDSHVFGNNDSNTFDLFTSETPTSKALKLNNLAPNKKHENELDK